MNFLNIGDLYKPLQKEQHEKFKTFGKILEMCHAKIKTAAYHGRDQECLIDVPHFIPGTPPYCLSELIIYLENQLSKNGFMVIKTPPNHLYISWKPTDIDYTRYRQSLSEHQRLQEMIERKRIEKENAKRQQIEKELKEYDESPRSSGRKKPTKNSGNLNHVAMVGYDEQIDDLIPVNRHKLRAIKGQPKREVKPGFKGPVEGSLYPFGPSGQ